MTARIQTGRPRHIKLTVTNVARSRDFYTRFLNFDFSGERDPMTFISNGSITISLALAPDPTQAPANDRFNENRVGLDHLSLAVENRAELERAKRMFEEQGVPHGDVRDLGEESGLYILAFRDPDNIQMELSAPRE